MNANHKLSTHALVAMLAASPMACKTEGEVVHPSSEIEGVSEIELPDEQAKARFTEVYAEYEAAKQDGLSSSECEALAEQFDEIYASNRKSMLVARFNVGALWEECGDLDKATKVYEELAARNFHLAINNLGVIAWNDGDHESARELFTKSVEADNKQAFEARNNLAAAHRDRYADEIRLEDFAIAEKQIQNVLAVDSSNKAAYENLARLYYDRGRLEDPSYLVLANLVVTQALRVLEKDGRQSADIWNLRGLLFMQDDNQVDALRAFKKAVEIDPVHADANRNIGFIAIRFRDYATAEGAFAVAVESPVVRGDIEVYLAMGVAKRGLKKFAEAETWYRKATEVDAKDPRPWYNLGILNQDHLIGQEDVEQTDIERFYATAKQHYREFEKVADGDKRYAEALADAHNRVAIIDDAIAAMEQMKELEILVEKARLAAEAAKQERINELLELERAAAAAGQPGPTELAEEADVEEAN
jgi:Tfp pilus assembly protein PilF